MNKFRIKNLHIKNLLSHEDTNIEFNDVDNFILIHGKDLDKMSFAGAGKSTIENALTFALFSKVYRGQTSGSINNQKLVSNWARESQESMIIDLTLSNSKDEINIIKEVVYNKPSETQTNILINGKIPKQFTTPQAPAKYLQDKIIQMDYKTFSKMHSFRTGNQIQFFSLRGMDQIDVMEKFVSKVNFSDMLKLIIEDVQLLNKKIDTIRQNKDNLQNQLDTLDQHEIQYVDAQIQKYKKRLDDAKQKLVETVAKFDDVIRHLDKIAVNKDKVEYLKTILKQLQKSIRTEGSNIKMNQRKIIEFRDLLKNIQCPTCIQKVDRDLIQSIISDREVSIKESMFKIKEMKEKYDTQNDLYKRIKEKLDKLVERKIKLIQKKSKYETRIKFYKRDIFECNEEVEKLGTDSPQYYEKARKETKTKLIKIKKELTRKENEMQRLKICVDALKKRSTLKQYILQPLMPIFSNLMNKYFPVLWGSNVKGKVVITPANNVEFQILKGYSANEYESASSGECRIIDIAALLSFIEFANIINRTTLGVMVLDEILESLDKVLALKVVNLLKDFAVRKNIQILFITNNSIIIENQARYGIFDKEIVFQKKHGKTKMLGSPEELIDFDY